MQLTMPARFRAPGGELVLASRNNAAFGTVIPAFMNIRENPVAENLHPVVLPGRIRLGDLVELLKGASIYLSRN